MFMSVAIEILLSTNVMQAKMRLEDDYRHGGDLIVLVPVQPGSDTNIVRVQRYHHNEDVCDI